MRRLDLSNQVFGRLTVKARIEGVGETRWLCQCSCGDSKEIRTSHLVHGGTKSCGCLQREIARMPRPYRRKPRPLCACGCREHVLRMDQRFLKGHNARKRPYEALYNSLVWHAKRKSIPVEMTYEEFLPFTRTHSCFYCGCPVCYTPYCLGKSKAGSAYNLDRRDNKAGYSVSNVVVCCPRCNKAKSDHFSYEEWLEMTTPLRLRHEGVMK